MAVEQVQFLEFIRRRKKRLTENLLSFDSSSFAHPRETVTTSHRPRTLTAVGAFGPSLLLAPYSLALSKTPPTRTGCLIFIDVSPAITFVTATSTRVRTANRCQRFDSSLCRGGIQIETHNDDDRSDEEDWNHAAHCHSNARKQNDIGLSLSLSLFRRWFTYETKSTVSSAEHVPVKQREDNSRCRVNSAEAEKNKEPSTSNVLRRMNLLTLY